MPLLTRSRRWPLYVVATWLFWIGFFEVARGLFLVYHWPQAAGLEWFTMLRTFVYGARLDASLAAYCALPIGVALALARQAVPGHGLRVAIVGFTLLLLSALSLVIVVDLELYRHWGFRIDTTLTQYLNTPTEMVASAGAAPVGWLVLLYVGLVVVAAAVWARTLGRWQARTAEERRPRWGGGAVALGQAALLVLPLRGGWQQIPVNQSAAYFSTVAFANHAALNAPWNLLYYALRGESGRNPYAYLPEAQARAAVAALYQDAVAQEAALGPLVRVGSRPNVLVIILESFTGKLVRAVGGEVGVTPAIDSLAWAGLTFTCIYAAGNRSEKGLVAVLSGYPAQTTTSLTRVPRKAEHLPHLARELKARGYGRATYWYGGELEFANMKAYLLSAGYERLFEKSSFPAALAGGTKWGVPDGRLLPIVADSLRRAPGAQAGAPPWLATVFTLSSHEPYEVPRPLAYPASGEANQFRSAMRYTDGAVGGLLRTLRADRRLWDSTLVVLVADHGHQLPGDTPEDVPDRFHIPLIVTGGALNPALRGKRVAAIGSQTDLLATLLAALPPSPLSPLTPLLPFSRDLLGAERRPFAFYVFNDGFGLLTSAGVVSYDNVGHRVITRDPGVPEAQLRAGQALMQETFADFLSR